MVIKAAPGLHRGETLLVTPEVNVDSVTGIEAYEADTGELRGTYKTDDAVKLTVKYNRTFNSGAVKLFTCIETVDKDNNDISLSKAPWHNIKGDYVTNVSIEVSNDKV